MDVLQNLGMLLGGSWASGVNLYLTVAGLGIADRVGVINLPGSLDTLSNPMIIAAAVLLYGVEFFADKIPYVDNLWDSFHTVIRPAGATVMGYMAMSGMSPAAQTSIALLCGFVSMDAHLTKATTRVAINASPEPFTNSIASVTEDGLVIAALWLIAKHPVIAAVIVISFIVFSIWFLRVMFRFLKKVFKFVFKGGEETPQQPG